MVSFSKWIDPLNNGLPAVLDNAAPFMIEYHPTFEKGNTETMNVVPGGYNLTDGVYSVALDNPSKQIPHST
eukprot:GABW01005008.1.p2 GENE.GABW01005008.1~~GABW01005008.1.p2  ORF type:complete len:71 (-),score=31.29 GABW01005008.1:3-215(-)